MVTFDFFGCHGHFQSALQELRMTTPARLQLMLATLLLWELSGCAISTAAEPIPAPPLLYGVAFQKELDKPFAGSWSSEPFRGILTAISTDRRVSIVLDRRLDPSREFQVSIQNVTLTAGLRELAVRDDGQLSVPGNFAYLAPAHAAKRLRTVIELRSQELKSKDPKITAARQAEILRRRTVSWNDLDSPKEILTATSVLYGVQCVDQDAIPHDLWAAATLPDVNFVEAVSTILNQFDLTFQWTDQGDHIELIPIPDSISIERKYSPGRKPIDDLISQIRDQFPDAQVQQSKNDLIVNAFIEDHEGIANLLRGKTDNTIRKPSPLKPVKQRSFTFNSNQPVPISALMKKLEESDIRFEYDASELQAAGIDLDQKIELDAKNMPATTFFQSIFEPSRIEFEFDETTIKLRPKK